MGDDYEILDPTRTEAKFTDDAPPSTPIMSSIKQPVIDGGQRNGGDNKMGSESNIRQKWKGKKGVEMQMKEGKRSKKDEKNNLHKYWNR
ncbi:unnamed protein product [Acanthocheilonema viteae]|uniref:Uncharacterized protein n=1 Tax=Acanthocheilonema viteae TaxID=6277 RepID=A0A498SWM3_ACAVI|nr:unnamed protein product [Acanthocheilonema viteae]